jgi:hypothetical protein
MVMEWQVPQEAQAIEDKVRRNMDLGLMILVQYDEASDFVHSGWRDI